MSTSQIGKGPVERFRDGGVIVKVWEQEGGEKDKFLTATVGRTYRDTETGEYGEGRSFTRAELNKLPSLIMEANKFMRDWEVSRKREARSHEAQPELLAQAESGRSGGLTQQRDEALRNAAKNPVRDAPTRERSPER
jgi:hypothetical protein